MPTLLLHNNYRFFFYSNEGNEPAHIHVVNAEKDAKIWLVHIDVAHYYGFTTQEITVILQLVRKNQKNFLEAWHEHFSNTL